MGKIQTQLPTETWVNASWEEYLQMIENPVYQKAKSYDRDRRMRIEMLPVGNAYYRDRSIVIYAVLAQFQQT
ncbi:MAG: hypothetical protein WBA24_02595 [Geitlerinemataceae cyanobacterium]